MSKVELAGLDALFPLFQGHDALAEGSHQFLLLCLLLPHLAGQPFYLLFVAFDVFLVA